MLFVLFLIRIGERVTFVLCCLVDVRRDTSANPHWKSVLGYGYIGFGSTATREHTRGPRQFGSFLARFQYVNSCCTYDTHILALNADACV